MDLISLKIRVADRLCQVVLQEAAGPQRHELTGAAFARVLATAEPLLVRLAQEGGGPVHHVSIDALGGVLTATFLRQKDGLPRSQDERAMLHEHGANMGEVGEVPAHLTALTLDGDDYRHLLSLLRELARVAQREAHPRVPDPPGLDVTDAAAWEHKYHNGGDGWELMRPAPPLCRYLAQHPLSPGTLALVPGCGRGHEARLLAKAGAQVVAIDIALAAASELLRLTPDEDRARMTVRLADLFTLPDEPGERGRYDLVLEHCCFCAVDPGRRDEYVRAIAELLRPAGRLLGLFWCFEQTPGRAGGPPFPATREEIRRRFAARFDIAHEETPGDSVLARSGQEMLVELARR